MDQILGLINLVLDFLANQFVDVTTTIIVIVTGLFYAFKYAAKLTKTTKDDEIVEKIEQILEQLLDEKFPGEFPSEDEKKRTVRKIAKNLTKEQ